MPWAPGFTFRKSFLLAGLLYKHNIMPKPRKVRINGAIYSRIAVLRAERSLTRQALADAIAVNVQTIGYLERGDYRPSLELAFRLSEYFDLPVEGIFARDPFVPLTEQVYGAWRNRGSAGANTWV